MGLLGTYLAVLVFQLMDNVKYGQGIVVSPSPLNALHIIAGHMSSQIFRQYIVLVNALFLMISIALTFVDHKGKILQIGLIKITDKIQIPAPAGSGQYGSQHFMTVEELSQVKELSCYLYRGNKGDNAPRRGGFVVGIKAVGAVPEKSGKEEILYIGEDRHVLLVGATRCGKTRRHILESIWLTLNAGENMVVTDPKGELWAYTSPYAEKQGYQTVTLDFRDPNKGNHFNFLQEIIDAVEREDVGEAIDLTWDLVAVLVGEAKGEPIWHNGECAAIAAVIMIVATEAPKEYRNLTNVYYFLFNMAKSDSYGEMPISKYLEELPETHPARAVFAMAEIAHVKTRGSFFSSALGTLKYFTNPRIAEMTSRTDFKFCDMVNKKTITYIILPDEKTTLYALGSMYIMQHYTYLVKETNGNGGRCPIGWWYFLDEFGNLPYIPPIPQYLSVGAGRGMRFVLALQDFQQLKKKYKDDYSTIKNNCDCWIYLKASEGETQKEFSERCGSYTVQVNSTNFSVKENGGKDGSYSASLTGRKLLLPEEIGLIEAPYSLISLAGKYPIMLIAPDLRFYRMNEELGLGDEEHNRKLVIERNRGREERKTGKMLLWGIWNEYKEMEEDYSDYVYETEEKINFLK